MSAQEASEALAEARKHLGAPYELGARGPGVFDSSILHAYRRVIPTMRLRVSERDANLDVPHSLSYGWNFQPLPLKDLRPGDLVYITDGTQPVTHGALFVRWLKPYRRLEFLHALTRHFGGVSHTDRSGGGRPYHALGSSSLTHEQAAAQTRATLTV